MDKDNAVHIDLSSPSLIEIHRGLRRAAREKGLCERCYVRQAFKSVPTRSRETIQLCEKCAQPAAIVKPIRTTDRIGRNAVCPCGSGLKFKKCCKES